MDGVEAQKLVKKFRYLTVKQAAELAGVGERFIRNRIGKEGGPPYRKKGRVYKLPTFEFLLWNDQPEIK